MINNSLFVAKTHAPYTDDQLSAVLLNPDARVARDQKTAEFTYPDNFAKLAEKAAAAVPGGAGGAKTTLERLREMAARVQTETNRVGIDMEDFSAVPVDNDTFVQRNFTGARGGVLQPGAQPAGGLRRAVVRQGGRLQVAGRGQQGRRRGHEGDRGAAERTRRSYRPREFFFFSEVVVPFFLCVRFN